MLLKKRVREISGSDPEGVRSGVTYNVRGKDRKIFLINRDQPETADPIVLLDLSRVLYRGI